MSVGYPDYARLDRQGGYLLYGVENITPAYDTSLVQAYVGAWPYLTLALSCNMGADTAQIVIAYFTDETFTVRVGFRIVVRQSTQFSVTQYANLSEWVSVYYVTQSGNPALFASFSVYASVGQASQTELVSTDVPIFQTDASIAATTTVNTTPQHVQPGRGLLNIYTNATSWFVILYYYDFGSASFLRLLQVDQTIAAKGGVFDISMLDAPMQVQIDNRDAGAETFRISIMSAP
jgi:hypothetical protein